MEKVSLNTLKTILDEFKGYVEQYNLDGDLKSSFQSFQDAKAIENVIAILSTRDLINNDTVKVCSKCGQTKSISEYPKNPGRKLGIRPDCKVCYLKQKKTYRDSKKLLAD